MRDKIILKERGETMSKSILNAILKGNLLPWEEKFINTPKFNELIEKIDQDRTYFENNLSPNEQCRFDQYTCLITELGSEETASELSNIFLIGILLGMEIIEHKQDFLKSEEDNDDK